MEDFRASEPFESVRKLTHCISACYLDKRPISVAKYTELWFRAAIMGYFELYVKAVPVQPGGNASSVVAAVVTVV